MPCQFRWTLRTGLGVLPWAGLLIGLWSLPLLGQPKPPEVIAAAAYTTTFVDRVEALGTLRAYDAVELTAQVTEQISALHFDDGDQVEAGQVLVELVDREERALLAQARAARDEAQDQLQRSTQLSERGLTPDSELSLRRREFRVAEAQISAMEARIADRLIRAPFAGRMGLRVISVGATVEPGDPIAQLIDDRVMKLDFAVPSAFLANLRPGIAIEARTRAYPEEVFSGEVRSVDSVIDPVTRAVMVRATLPNPDGRLLPGLLMTVDLLLNPRTTLAVPEESVIPTGDQTFVWVVEPRDDHHVVNRRPITTGARRVGDVEVLAGLAPGEWVVTEGTMKIRPGQTVAVTRAEGDTPVPLLSLSAGRED
ncbi:MAG: efflux RND transporter periplasmic adaptor subunit [Candidatus Competibacterales bacterium]